MKQNLRTRLTHAPRRSSLLLAATFALVLAGTIRSRADSGTWTNDASSVWSATTNWLNGTVADGAGNTADFSLDNSNTDIVTLDASHSLGTLQFGSAAALNTNRWILNETGGSVLTLAGGTPTIAVTNGAGSNSAVLALPVAGTSGLTKIGNGTLVMAGANTYSGGTIINKGTLKLTNTLAGISTLDPVLYFSFDDVDGATVINQGTGGAVMNGMLFGGATIVPGGRYGSALSIPGGNSTVSYVLVNNAVVPLNIPAGNNWTVAMWLQTFTAGAAYFYQGSGGWASGNTEFYLENGTAGDGAGSHAGGVRFAQGWESGTANINDGAWHFVVMTCTNAVKTLYVDGAVDPFISGVNQWNASGTGNQIRIGGSAGAADSAIGLNGLIDEFYMFNRALSLAEVQTLMNTSSGATSVASAQPPADSISVTAPAVLDLNGHSPMVAGLTGNGTVDTTLGAGAPTLVVSNGTDVQFDGLLTNSVGTLALTKIGSGKLTLTGTNVYNGATTVNAGTLNITGAFEPVNPAAATMIIGNGVVNFSGSYLTNFNYNIGTATNTAGALYHTAGILKQTQGANGANLQVGNAPGAYGYYYIGAGATNFCNEIGIGGEANPSGDGLVDVNGGTLIDSGWIVVARGGSRQIAGLPQIGVLNVYPGSLMTYAGGGLQCNWGSGGAQLSVINMLGGLVTNSSANLTINLNQSGNAANTGILNLNGGTIQAGWVSGGPNGTRVNFNGGTLQAAENQAVEMTGLADCTIYSGGGTINNNGFTLVIGQQFLAPTGNGINGISSFTGGAGYIAPPIVQVVNDPSDSTGVGATAIAQINPATGVVTNVLITCPGVNYTATPSFVLTGGNPTTPATITGAAPTPNTSGGMTFVGSGSTTMNGGYTYTGPTTVANGTLSLIPAAVTPSVAGNLVVSNATVSFPSTNGNTLSVGNLILQNNGTIGIAYGTVFSNPNFAAMTMSGGIIFAPTNIINISGFGLRPGTFTVIKYGSGTVSASDFANLGYTLPAGVVGTLVNNTGNNSIDLNITSSPNQLTWQGEAGNNWDLSTVNWTNDANGLPALYQQYTNSGVIAGDGVIFDDSLTNDFVNPQPTNVNLTATFTPFPVTVNSTLPYTIGGSGSIAGVGNVVKNNTGSLTLLTSNTFAGGLAINGGSVIVTNDFSLGTNNGTVTLNTGTLVVNGNTTNNSRVLSVPATSSIDVTTTNVARFGGTVSGFGGLTKTDTGTLVLAGANSISGNLIVNQGTLNTLGTENLPAVVTVGDAAGQNATLTVGGGTFNALNNGGQFTSGLLVGSIAGAFGDIRLTGGTMTAFQQTGLGGGVGAYAALNNSGGAFIGGSYIVVGFNGDTAVYNQTAGSTTVNSNLMTIAAGGSAAVGVANFFGGTYLATNSAFGNPSGRGGIFVGENGTGTLNISGTATVTAGGETNVTIGRTGAASSGTVNLFGGTLTTLRVLKGAGSATFNFNGGTLKALGSTPTFVAGLNDAFVYNGGAVIDDSGFTLTVPQPLLGATGYGVTSIPITPSTSSGYIDIPIVTISGGSGSNAMATATVSGGQVTSVIVTCPGTGYAPSDVLSVTFSGGGALPTPPTVGTVTLGPNGTGGLTKKGAGSVSLTGVNTFTGPITNAAGALSLSSASSYSGAVVVNAGSVTVSTASTLTGPTIVTNGAAFTVTQVGLATNAMSDLTLNGTATLPGATLGVGLTGKNPSAALINCGTLTVNGTNTISLSGAVSVGAIPLVKYTTLAGSGTLTNLTLPQGVIGFVSNSVSSSTIYAVITDTGPGLVWTGTNSNPALTNLWDIASTVNWLLGATPTTYHQPIIPGDAVTFNDSGSGTVIINTNVGPSTLTISNNIVGYTFGGRGNVTGSGGIMKLGAGTAILNLTNNNYTGDTIVSNGTLQIGSPTAISSAANLNVSGSGTVELNGLSPVVSGLFGNGVIDDNNTTNVTLTVNNGGVWNGTIRDQGLGGGASLTKLGNNILVLGGTNYLNNTAASQVNAGITIMTNGAVIGCASSEFWVGPVGGLVATNIVDGGTLVVSNNFLVVGRGSATANGTLIINNGTVQKAGANVVVVGSLGATGTLIVNGGQLLNNNELWLGEGPTAVAAIYLNGGLVQATDIRMNNFNGLPTAAQIAYFNGGTLQASGSSADFLQVTCQVMSNGFVLDDNGFTLSIASATLDPGDTGNGGMIKKGSGTVYLDSVNTYTGTTIVTNGTLAGSGVVASNVVVGPAGTLGAGDAAAPGTFTINGSITLNGGTSVRVNKTGGTPANDQIAGFTSVNFGGVLVVTNITSDATPLTTSDTFQIFSKGGSGNFTSIIGSPGPGLAFSFNPATGQLGVVTGVASNPTNISFSVTGSTMSLTWPGDHLGWILQGETNQLQSNTWFDVTGTGSATNFDVTVSPTNTPVFFRLRHP